MITTRGLSHVELAVRDVEVAVRFYGEVFGFEVVRAGEGGALLQTPRGQGSLALEAVASRGGASVTRFGLRLRDRRELDAAVALALANGGVLLDRTDHAVGGSTVVLADPAGHRLTL